VLHNDHLADLWQGLALNNLHDHYTHLLTGYVGSDDFLRQIGSMVKDLRKVNPKLVYVCDPVMGDEGHMYVPKSLLPIYRDEIVPLADIVTPNQYEVELLTGKKMTCEGEAWESLEWFHNLGVKTVVLTSTDFSDSVLYAYISHKQKDGVYQRYRIDVPRLGGHIHFTGTGDLFAAVFLAHSELCEGNMGMALEKAVNTLQAVIKNTLRHIPEEVRSGKVPVTSDQRELKLVQCKQQIESPVIELHAEKC
jgi:pyridoxine kinase